MSLKSVSPDQFPLVRHHRLRSNDFIRRLVCETKLSVDDLIYPVFVTEGRSKREAIKSLPGQERLSLDELLRDCDEICKLKIPAIAFFPVIDAAKKSADAREAYNENGLACEVIRTVKKKFPGLGVISDIALDPYSSHGQDGLINDKGEILNDETIAVLVKQSLSHAASGIDIIAPSDMMDGRVGVIRTALEENGFKNTKILAYSAKYASSLYDPFRDAVGSSVNLGKSSKETYQMDFANSNEALREVAFDIAEGADIVMIKPAGIYLDVIARIKNTFNVPTFAYHVSGEYAMLKAAAQNGWLDEKKCVLETLTSIKRAGANAMLTYYAKDVAKWITS